MLKTLAVVFLALLNLSGGNISQRHINNTTDQVTKVEQPVKDASSPESSEGGQSQVEKIVMPSAQPVERLELIKPVEVVPTTPNETLMHSAGIQASEYAAVSYIVSHESTWCPYRWNGDHRSCEEILASPGNASMGSGAYGLCQAMPASKMASEGSDYMTNPMTQLRWCSKYASERYEGWDGAYTFWLKKKYW